MVSSNILFFEQRENHAVMSDSDLSAEEELVGSWSCWLFYDEDHLINFPVENVPSRVPMTTLSKIATFLAMTSTIFNLVYLAYMSMPNPLHGEPDLASLTRPNQFIGLERINFTKHAFPNVKIATFAGVVAKIDRSRPKFVYPVEPHRNSTYFEEARNVLATNQARL